MWGRKPCLGRLGKKPHLVSREVQILLIFDHLPDLLKAHGEHIAGKLVAAWPYKTVIICITQSNLAIIAGFSCTISPDCYSSCLIGILHPPSKVKRRRSSTLSALNSSSRSSKLGSEEYFTCQIIPRTSVDHLQLGWPVHRSSIVLTVNYRLDLWCQSRRLTMQDRMNN